MKTIKFRGKSVESSENDMTADFKVIGNVYEHSHLLEATK